MTAWKAAPPIMQNVMICLRTYLDCNKCMKRCALLGFATSDEVRPRSANRIFYDIGQKSGQSDADEEAQNRDVGLVYARTCDGGKYENDEKGYETGIDEVPFHWHSLYKGMRIRFGEIVKREHAMKGLNKKLNLKVIRIKSTPWREHLTVR